MKLHVLHVDNHVLAVAKPAGLPTVPDASGDTSLLDLAKDWVRIEFAKPGDVFLGVVHRLDRPVSGVVVFGRTSKGAARLTESFRTRSARKTYVGLVPRNPAVASAGESHELVQWLHKDRERNHVSVVPESVPGAREARTTWRVLARAWPAVPGTPGRPCVMEFTPQTGRSHQLRLAARTLVGPLLGDLRYGAAQPLDDRSIALHARRLEVAHPTRSEALVLEAPWPGLEIWTAARSGRL